MRRFVQFVLLLVLFSCGLAVVSATKNATFVEQIGKLWDESSTVMEEARRRRKYPFTKHVWCKLYKFQQTNEVIESKEKTLSTRRGRTKLQAR
jgi:hypothetical protein